jgi:hypothetical protein
MGQIKNQITDWFENSGHSVGIVFFLLNIFLIYSVFLPNLSDINPWDEAAYLSAGQTLIEGGEFPKLAGNPLTTVFFAFTYLPFRTSPLWIVHSVTLARLILFSMLWLGTYLVARQLSQFAPPVIAIGTFLVMPITIEILRFPTDPLFASLASLSLWQLLVYKDSGKRHHLAFSSLFMGFAALSRNDGLILFVILVILTVFLGIRKKELWRSMPFVLVPFIFLVGGYILVYGLITGDYQPGTMERTYTNFESGQQVVYSGTGEFSPVIESRLEARAIFGTPEENRNSVFRAIRRNPKEYFRRLTAVIKDLPRLVLHAYGIRFAVVLLILAGRGVFELIKRREFALLIVLCVWPLHLVTGFLITLFRPGHLQFPFYVILALSSIGLSAIITNLRSKNELSWISVLILGITVYSLVDNKLAIFYGGAVFLAGLWIVYFIETKQVGIQKKALLMVFLIAGIIIRGGFPSPKIRILGSDPKEQAVLFIVENYLPDTTFAAASPGIVWTAKMGYAGLSSSDVPQDKSSSEFIDWLADQGIEAIYVDHDLSSGLPGIWKLIEPQIGHSLDRVFEVERGNYQVLQIVR